MVSSLKWRAPEIGEPEDASLYSEETEERLLEADVLGIKARHKTAAAGREKRKEKPSLIEPARPVTGLISGPITQIEASYQSSPAIEPSKASNDLPRNVMNFLFSEDMAIWGMKWDQEGFSWNFETMKEQWAQEPLWSTVTLGLQGLTLIAPYAKALKIGGTGLRVGRRGTKAATGIAGAAGMAVPGGIVGGLLGGPAGAAGGAAAGAAAGAAISKLPGIRQLAEPGFKYYKGVGLGDKRHTEQLIEKINLGEVPKEVLESAPYFGRWKKGDYTFYADEQGAVPWFSQFAGMDERGARKAEIAMFTDLGVINPGKWLGKYGDSDVKRLVRDLGDNAHVAPLFLTEKQALDAYMKIPWYHMSKLRRAAQHYNTNARLRAKAALAADPESGVGPLTKLEEKILWFNNKFGNSFYAKTAVVTPDDAMRSDIGEKIGRWNAPTNVRELFRAVPSAQAGRIFMHKAIKQSADLSGEAHSIPDAPPIPKDAAAFFKRYEDVTAERQQIMHGDGFLFDDEPYNPVYVSMVRRKHKMQRGPGDGYIKTSLLRDKETGETSMLMSSGALPRLDDPALLPRRKPWDEVYEDFTKGQMFDTPEEIILHSTVNSEMLYGNYKIFRDVITDNRYINSRNEAMAKYYDDAAEKLNLPPEWVDLDDLVTGMASARLKNMIRKKIGDNPEELKYVLGSLDKKAQTLPIMRAGAADALFGPQGVDQQGHWAAQWLEALTSIMKTGATALNPATHIQNILGNSVFLAQAGMSPISPTTLRLARDLSKNFKAFSAAKRLGQEADWADKHASLMIKYKDTEIPFVDLIGYGKDRHKSGLISELLVENAFEHVEGWRNLERIYDRARVAENPNLKAFLHNVLKLHDPKMDELAAGIKPEEFSWAARQYRNWITKSFDNMTGAYLAEDILVKQMLFIKNLSDGFSWRGALNEVGRRMPMYNSIGSAQKGARKYVLPWITFPAEAARITKNNIMDAPLMMLPWLRAPQIMQSTAFALGFTGEGETFESLEYAKRGIPLWSQQGGETIMVGGQRGRVGTGATTAAVLGAVGGTAAGGPIGALIGGLAGGVAGAGASYFLDREGDHIRGGILNWLPHSSFMMSELRAPDFHFTRLKDVWDVAPAEPFAIARPIIETFFGKDQWGNDAFTGGFGDSIKKGIAGYIGFLAPPLVQRFGYNTATPDIALYGNEWTSGAIVGAAAGLLGMAVSKRTGVPFKQAISASTTAKAAGIGAVLGGTADVSRIYTDTGLKKDAHGREANPAHDFLFSVGGGIRTWPSRPETQIANEANWKKHIREVRSYLGRHLRFYAENGDDEQMLRALKDIQITFKSEFHDPVLAQQRYTDWLQYYTSSIGVHPSLRSMSKEEMMARMMKASAYAQEVRGVAIEEMRDLLIRVRSEQIARAAAARKRRR